MEVRLEDTKGRLETDRNFAAVHTGRAGVDCSQADHWQKVAVDAVDRRYQPQAHPTTSHSGRTGTNE